MKNLQRIGGISAILSAIGYIVGMVVALIFLAPVLEYTPQNYIVFLSEHLNLMYLWHMTIYIVPGVVLVSLVLAIYELLKDNSPALGQISAAFGMIWAGLVIASGMLLIKDAIVVVELYDQDPAQAVSVFLALSAVEDALGGGIELPGGIWLFSLSLAALRTGVFNKWLNYFGMLIGIAGIVTVVPALYNIVNIFGLGLIVWFIGVGIIMLRRQPSVK